MGVRRGPSQYRVEDLAGDVVAGIRHPDPSTLEFAFESGKVLTIAVTGSGLDFSVRQNPETDGTAAVRPTTKQLEYLHFIVRYILQFRVSPSERDMQRHFMVSAPSVHAMVKTLERRGFIVREPGVARSIRVCIGLSG